MPDPIVVATRRLVSDAFEVLRRAIDGAPDAALDTEPGAPEHTNSIAVLTTHSLNATRLMLSVCFGLPQPDRDRDAEFAATSGGADRLLRLVDEIGGECLAILDEAPDTVDWGTMRAVTRADGSTSQQTAAFWIVHIAEHLRGHADEAGLTRHIWDARA